MRQTTVRSIAAIVLLFLPLVGSAAAMTLQSEEEERSLAKWEAESFINCNAVHLMIEVEDYDHGLDENLTRRLTSRLTAKLSLAGIEITPLEKDAPFHLRKQNNIISVNVLSKKAGSSGVYVLVMFGLARSVFLMDSPSTLIFIPVWERSDSKTTSVPREYIENTFDQYLTELLMNIYAAKGR